MVYRKRSSAVFWGVRGAKSLESRTTEVASVIDALAKRAQPYAGPRTSLEQDETVLRDALETLRAQHEELLVADEELRAQLEEFHSLEETVQSERARSEQIFLQAPDAYLLTDNAGTIQECNLAATRLFAIDERYLCGKPLGALVHKDDIAKFRAMVISRAQEPIDRPMRVLSRQYSEAIQTAAIVSSADGGNTFFWRFRVTRGDSIENATGTGNDAAFTEERATRDEHERSSMAKDRLIALVSHDMRGPLNAIIGWTELLRQSSVDEPMRKKALATIERNGRAQAALIEDLLDISRITLGKLRVELKSLDLAALARAAVDAVRPAADARTIVLKLTVPEEKVAVLGDRERLQQLLGNLLGNAIKFTPAAGIITIALTAADSQATITVADTGRGITPDAIRTVFDCFQQASASQHNQGLGLGLYIARQIAQLHHGTLSAHSEGLRKGSTFTLELPLIAPRNIAADHSEPAIAQPYSSATTLADINVLVVDNDPDARELMSLMLRKAGASVVMASSMMSALETFEAFQPDVVVSDIRMSQADGNDLVRALRKSKYAKVPALAISESSTAADARRAIDSGFDAYLVKPVLAQTLIDAVAKAAALHRL